MVAVSTGAPAPKVLVAEDDDDARELLSMLLRDSGYDVIEAADGRHALDAIARGDLTVALVDIGLPGLDGETVARRARDVLDGRALRMVAVTGYGARDDVRRLLGAGFDEHITKPVDIRKLREMLAQ